MGEGFYPARRGIRRPVYVTAGPWPGLPIRKGNRKQKAADLVVGTWPNLTGKFKPHDDRHTHSGARRLRELTAGDVHHALTTMAQRYSSASVAMATTRSPG